MCISHYLPSVDCTLHSPAGCIPEHHAVLEKKERLTHDFPSDPLSGWTCGWRGQREAEVSKKKKTVDEKKERAQSLRAFATTDLQFKIARCTVCCWPGSLK